MLTHERDPNASGGSSPPEDSKNSGASGNKGKGSRRRTRQTVINRSARKVVVARSPDDSMYDFVKPPTRVKKDTSAKVSKKVGGRKSKGNAKMTVSKALGVKKVS
jgi:hypothetical protein